MATTMMSRDGMMRDRKLVYWLNTVGTPNAVLVEGLKELSDGVVLREIIHHFLARVMKKHQQFFLPLQLPPSSPGSQGRNLCHLLTCIGEETTYRPAHGYAKAAVGFSVGDERVIGEVFASLKLYAERHGPQQQQPSTPMRGGGGEGGGGSQRQTRQRPQSARSAFRYKSTLGKSLLSPYFEAIHTDAPPTRRRQRYSEGGHNDEEEVEPPNPGLVALSILAGTETGANESSDQQHGGDGSGGDGSGGGGGGGGNVRATEMNPLMSLAGNGNGNGNGGRPPPQTPPTPPPPKPLYAKPSVRRNLAMTVFEKDTKTRRPNTASSSSATRDAMFEQGEEIEHSPRQQERKTRKNNDNGDGRVASSAGSSSSEVWEDGEGKQNSNSDELTREQEIITVWILELGIQIEGAKIVRGRSIITMPTSAQLVASFRSGVLLCRLVEAAEGKSVGKITERPRVAAEAFYNVRKAVGALRRVDGFSNQWLWSEEKIVNGDPAAIWGILGDLHQLYGTRNKRFRPRLVLGISNSRKTMKTSSKGHHQHEGGRGPAGGKSKLDSGRRKRREGEQHKPLMTDAYEVKGGVYAEKTSPLDKMRQAATRARRMSVALTKMQDAAEKPEPIKQVELCNGRQAPIHDGANIAFYVADMIEEDIDCEQDCRRFLDTLGIDLVAEDEAKEMLKNPLRNGVILCTLVAVLEGAIVPKMIREPKDVASANTNVEMALKKLAESKRVNENFPLLSLPYGGISAIILAGKRMANRQTPSMAIWAVMWLVVKAYIDDGTLEVSLDSDSVLDKLRESRFHIAPIHKQPWREVQLSYDEETLDLLESTLMHWLYSIGLFGEIEESLHFASLKKEMSAGVLLCDLASALSGYPVKGVFRNPVTQGTRTANLRKACERLLAFRAMPTRFLHAEKAIERGERTAIIGILEDCYLFWCGSNDGSKVRADVGKQETSHPVLSQYGTSSSGAVPSRRASMAHVSSPAGTDRQSSSKSLRHSLRRASLVLPAPSDASQSSTAFDSVSESCSEVGDNSPSVSSQSARRRGSITTLSYHLR